MVLRIDFIYTLHFTTADYLLNCPINTYEPDTLEKNNEYEELILGCLLCYKYLPLAPLDDILECFCCFLFSAWPQPRSLEASAIFEMVSMVGLQKLYSQVASKSCCPRGKYGRERQRCCYYASRDILDVCRHIFSDNERSPSLRKADCIIFQNILSTYHTKMEKCNLQKGPFWPPFSIGISETNGEHVCQEFHIWWFRQGGNHSLPLALQLTFRALTFNFSLLAEKLIFPPFHSILLDWRPEIGFLQAYAGKHSLRLQKISRQILHSSKFHKVRRPCQRLTTGENIKREV